MKATRIKLRIVRQPKWIGGSGPDNKWYAQETETKVRGTSLSGAVHAARNCALKFFFGGNTKAFTKGRDAWLKLEKSGAHYVARYHPPNPQSAI